MTTPDAAAFRAAMATLGPDDYGRDAIPNMKPLNAALKAAGFDEIKAADRDEMLREMGASEPEATDGTPLEEPLLGMVRIRLDHAMADPVPLYVHGVGRFSLRVGQEHEIPSEALGALETSDCRFTVIKE